MSHHYTDAQEIATISFCSGCSCKANSARSGHYFLDVLIKQYTLNVWSRGKQLVFFFPRVLMLPSTSSQETSGLEGKQN